MLTVLSNILDFSYTNMSIRRGDRVDDGDGLENRCCRKVTVGSNPTPSAISKSTLL
jgi:hypothetical protein